MRQCGVGNDKCREEQIECETTGSFSDFLPSQRGPGNRYFPVPKRLRKDQHAKRGSAFRLLEGQSRRAPVSPVSLS